MDRIKRAYELADSVSSQSALAYLNHVVINSEPTPRRFGDVAKDWQKILNQRILPAVEYVTGVRTEYSGPRSFWITLARGHDKTGAIGRLCNWALAYTRRYINCIACAKDRDQANFLLESMQVEANLNPWLKRRLEFANYKVTGKASGSVLKAGASDAAGSFGARGDLIVLDELTHWETRGLWDTIMSGAEKRRNRVVVIITNAGLKHSWQEEELQKIKKFARLPQTKWWVYEAPGRLDTWMNEEAIQRESILLPPATARRVLFNQWIDPGEESGFVTRQEVDCCSELGKRLQLTYRDSPHNKDVEHFAAIDYGPVKDRTALCVLHQRPEDNILVIDRLDIMQGSRGCPVSIEAVERWIDEVRSKFRLAAVVIDPYQMESTIQRYTGVVPIERFEARGGKSNYELAANLRALIVNKQIAWYADCGGIPKEGRMHSLDDELIELIVKQMGYGFRIDHLPSLHDDRCVCVGMAALHCVQRGRRVLLPDDLTQWF